jgi:hypothetical protein
MSVADVSDLLYHRSGLLDMSGISNDMRKILASNAPEAADAVDLFVYRISRELGSLATALGGLDALVFTAGIGEHAAPVRARVCEDAAWLGIRLDAAATLALGPIISSPHSPLSVWVVPTNEESMITRHTLAHTPVKPTFPGLKKLLLPVWLSRGSADIAAIGTARALFQAPESARSTQHESLVEFLGQVSLFENLSRRAVPNRLFEPVLAVLDDVDYAFGNYVRAIFLECRSLGLTVMVFLIVISVPLRWAIAIGIFTGASNVIPYMGFFAAPLSGFAYALLAEDIHPLIPLVSADTFAIWVVAAVALAELLKDAVYEPFLLGGAVELHPLVVVIGVVGGATLFGAAGMLLAIPTITVVRVLVASSARHLKAYGLV